MEHKEDLGLIKEVDPIFWGANHTLGWNLMHDCRLNSPGCLINRAEKAERMFQRLYVVLSPAFAPIEPGVTKTAAQVRPLGQEILQVPAGQGGRLLIAIRHLRIRWRFTRKEIMSKEKCKIFRTIQHNTRLNPSNTHPGKQWITFWFIFHKLP